MTAPYRHRPRHCGAFARKGANVVVSGRHHDRGQALVEELKALGAESEFVRAEVTTEDEVRNLVEAAVARFGRLDVASRV